MTRNRIAAVKVRGVWFEVDVDPICAPPTLHASYQIDDRTSLMAGNVLVFTSLMRVLVVPVDKIEAYQVEQTYDAKMPHPGDGVDKASL